MVKGYLKYAALGVMLGALFMAGGCSQKKVKAEEAAAPAAASQESNVAPGAPEGLDTTPPVSAASNILEGRTTAPMLPVYFDFDKSVVRADQKSRMQTNASYLKDNASVKIRIEGNCDERGTKEYNLALGQRRANAAKKYLANMGVAVARMNTISFGSEKPLNFGHDELAWSQNRRDDFVQQ